MVAIPATIQLSGSKRCYHLLPFNWIDWPSPSTVSLDTDLGVPSKLKIVTKTRPKSWKRGDKIVTLPLLLMQQEKAKPWHCHYTGCCTTFCKGGKTWFQIYLWLKIHFNKFEIYQRTQGNKNCLNLIKFQLSSYFFVSAHLAKIHVFLTDFLIYFTRFHFRYSTFLTLSIWQIWLFWQFIWSITHFIFKTNKLFSYSKK